MKIFTFRTVWGQELRAHAKFRRDRMNGWGVITSFRFPICPMLYAIAIGQIIIDFKYGGRPPS